MIRTIFVPQNDSITLPIPKEYIGKALEIIAFPKDEIHEKEYIKKKITFNAISIDTREYKFDREEANIPTALV
ncbi:MAG: hypothetical protein LBT27_09760 [Prevotellaceae bacterium]|jgi:hypothetical protein|nr:hypothetical protein [Prevotellaceae bacterium]